MNNKGADQTARMRRLICAFVVHIWHKQILSWRRSFTTSLCLEGYTTKVFGVKSNCRLRDCPQIPQTYFKVKVIAALPQIHLSTSLSKAASFLSFGEEANVVTSGTALLFTGQR